MRLQRFSLVVALSIFLFSFLTRSASAADKAHLLRPVISKVYPNPAGPNDVLYLEGKNFIDSPSGLRMQNAETNDAFWEGTYVEFTTASGRKRVMARLMLNTPVKGVQVCSATVPRTAVSGKVKIITFAKRNAQMVGSMSAAVDLSIIDEAAANPATRRPHGAGSFLKAIPQKIVKDAYYYQTERIAREAKQAFVRQENLRRMDSDYDINRASYFNSVPALSQGPMREDAHGEEARLAPTSQQSFAAQFFTPPESTNRRPFYTLGNRETMQKDVQEDIYTYAQPLFERWTHIKLDSDPPPNKTGFTRPKFHLAYSVGLGGHGPTACPGGLARDVGFRLDFDFVHVNPLNEQMRRVLSFSLGADSRRTNVNSDREQRFLFLIRFR